MKLLGTLFRYLLSINTVWGLMILTAFGLCALGNYLPTTTVIPADRLALSNYTLTIRVKKDADDKPKSFDYTLYRTRPDVLDIPPGFQKKDTGRPWLISATRVSKGFALKWDFDDYGRYEVAVNGQVCGKGTLATLKAFTDEAFNYARKGFDIALGLVAAMVLFLGLMKVGEDAGIVQLVARAFHPLIRFLFPEIPRDHPANGAILMNITTSTLGLGNAATPFGLKAMKELQNLNKNGDIASDAQVMLLAYNTTGVALLPTTLLAVRSAAGCSDPFEIIGVCLLGGTIATIVAFTVAKLLSKVPFFSIQAALAEEGVSQQAAGQIEAQPEITAAGEEKP